MRLPRPSGMLWRHASFMRLWAAQTISSFGARIAREGLPLAAVLSIHAQPFALGLLAAVTTAPGVLVGLFSGGIVDRARKRGILILCDLVRAAALLSVPFAAWFHLLSMEQLLAVALLVGGANVLFDIADHAFLPALIGRADLMEGNTKLNVTESLAEIGGPAVAGALVQLLTAPFALAVNAATYIASAAFLGTIPARAEQGRRKERAPWWRDAHEGWRAVAANPFVLPLFVMATAGAFFSAFFNALYVVFAVRTLQLSPGLLGLVIACGGAAGLVGTGLASVLVRRLGLGRAILWSGLLSALSSTFIPLAQGALIWRVAGLVAAQLGGDAFGVASIIPATTTRQALLPADVLGRAAAMLQASSGAMRVIGAIGGGLLGAFLGNRSTLWVAVVGNLAVALWGFATPLRSLKDLPP